MLIFLLFLYVFTFFFSLKFLIKQLRLNGWTIFNYSFSYMILFYTVVPVISIMCFLLGFTFDNVAYILPNQSDLEVMFFTYLMIVLGIISFCLGNSKNIKFEFEFIKFKKINATRISTFIVFIFCVFSMFSLIKYIQGFGSFENAVAKAGLVRSGTFKDIEDSDTSYTFFFRFIFLSFIPLLYYFYLNKVDRTLFVKLILVFSSIVLFILYGFLTLSRQAIIDLFFMLLLSSLIKNNKVFNLRLLVFACLVFITLPVLDVFLDNNLESALELKKKPTVIIFNEFGFPFYSLMYSIQGEHGFYFFSDFIANLFGKFFPSSWNPGIEATNYLNSKYMIGEKIQYVPPAVFAQGYYSLGVLGIIIISYLTGLFFKFLDVLFRNMLIFNINFVVFYSYFIVNSLVWIRTGLPENYFYNIVFLSTLLFLSLSFKYKLRNI